MSGYYLLQRGEFTYNKSYSVGFDFGSIKRLEKYDQGALSTLYICFALDRFDSDFIKHYFDSLKWYREIYMISAEGARNHGLLNVPTEDFFATLHTLPMDTAEQRRIAEFFDLLTSKIEKQQALVDNLKKYKRGVLNAIFSTKLDSQNSGVLLSDICSSISSGKTKITTSNGRYPLFGSTGIVGSTDCAECSGKIVLVARVGANAGLVNYFEGVCGVTDNTLVLKFTDQKLLPKFVYHYLQYYDVNKMVFGSGQPLVTGGQLKNIMLPNLGDDQINRIVKFLDLLDERIAHAEKELHNLTLFKKSIYQNMFI